jgi:tellurite methyltransferase
MIHPREIFGDIDIYLFDQILKGRFVPGMKILDAGCGGGRNLVYFLGAGYEVFGVDQNPDNIAYVRQLAHQLAPQLPPDNFQIAAVEDVVFGVERFDAVLSSAVLHFARDESQFHQMLNSMWQQLKPGGLFFARLASSIGIENLIQHIDGRRFLLPDGSERFLVDEELLVKVTAQLQGEWLEPLKTTNVQNLRCMTTWVLRKRRRSLM